MQEQQNQFDHVTDKNKNSYTGTFESSHHTQPLTQKLGTKFSEFLDSDVAKEVGVYAQNAIRWIKSNPKTSTTLALLGALAVGAIVRRSISGVSPAPVQNAKKRR